MNPLEEFDPIPAIECWIAKRTRWLKSSTKSREIDWHRGVFKKAADKRYTKRQPKIWF